MKMCRGTSTYLNDQSKFLICSLIRAYRELFFAIETWLLTCGEWDWDLPNKLEGSYLWFVHLQKEYFQSTYPFQALWVEFGIYGEYNWTHSLISWNLYSRSRKTDQCIKPNNCVIHERKVDLPEHSHYLFDTRGHRKLKEGKLIVICQMKSYIEKGVVKDGVVHGIRAPNVVTYKLLLPANRLGYLVKRILPM